MMISRIALDLALREREREVAETVRRRRLELGEGADPYVERAPAVGRARREEHRPHPARLATP